MESKTVSVKRLEKLKNAMILNHLEDIDFNNEDERALAYESLLSRTIIDGEFDDIFLSQELDGLDEEEKNKIFDLSRKYSFLCFYRGNIDYWLDSVEGITLGNEDTTVEILLSNYNYLIRLAKNGGEKVLSFLSKFNSNAAFENDAIIAQLLLRFSDDDTLEKVLIEMVSEDGLYNGYTDTQKIIMCDSPDGVLYRKNEDGVIELISCKEISNLYAGENSYSMKDIDSNEFKKFIEEIHTDYMCERVYKK